MVATASRLRRIRVLGFRRLQGRPILLREEEPIEEERLDVDDGGSETFKTSLFFFAEVLFSQLLISLNSLLIGPWRQISASGCEQWSLESPLSASWQLLQSWG